LAWRTPSTVGENVTDTVQLAPAASVAGNAVGQLPPLRAKSPLTLAARLLKAAVRLADRSGERFPTPELNRLVAGFVADRPPPQRHGRRLRLYYSAQIERRPPRIAIQVNDRRLIQRDWAFYLENRLREAKGLEGVPLVIDYVPRKRDRGGAD